MRCCGPDNDVGDAVPDSIEPVTLTGDEQFQVSMGAAAAGVPPDVTDKVLDAAVDMAKSTWVDVADAACNIAENL